MQGRDIVKKNRFKAPAWFSKCGIFTRLELQCMLTLIFSSIQNVSTHITCKLYINFLRNNHFSKQNLVFSIFAKRALKSLGLVKKPQTFEIFYYYVVRAYSPFFLDESIFQEKQPIYHVQKWLESCILSFLAQTNANWGFPFFPFPVEQMGIW